MSVAMLNRASSRSVERVRRDAGFTLIELLVVVAIIAMLGSILAFAMMGARNSALERKTKVIVRRLDEAMMARYKSYETRRIVWQEGRQPPPGQSPSQAARKRLEALRELMRMELPCEMKEIQSESQTGIVRPAASRAYQRRITESKDKQGKPANQSQDFATYANAECLYMILTTRMGEEESIRDSVRDSEIGDVDGDGLPEFLDGWGNPIMFLRWAPAFESELQPQEARLNAKDKKWHDAFDPQMIEPEAFMLFPLIYSAGRDQKYDIKHKNDGGDMNKPYANKDGLGKPTDEDDFRGGPKDGRLNDGDNIHNHMAL